MLVLSRKAGETIHIGDQVTLTVLSVRGGVIKLGIDAPQNVRIRRGELLNHLPAAPEEPDSSAPREALAV